MKIRDNETGEVFEYGTNIHHALRISRNGGCLIFENLQNGDGSLESGDGGYSFVLDDGMTPKESDSPDAINYATYANIGGFHGDTTKNDGWISVEERLPEPGRIVLITQTYSWENFEEGASVTIGRLSPEKNNKMWEFQYYRPDFRSGTIMDNDIICPGSEYVIAWRPLPEPYCPERSEGE